MKRFALSTVVMVCLGFAALSDQETALADDAVVHFNGGGSAIVTDPNSTSSPLSFAMAGSVSADGSVRGGAKFLFKKPFARDWGAVPGVDRMSLDVEFTEATIAEDGSIVLSGEWVEIDYSFGDGVVFVEEDTELTSMFELVIAPDGESFMLQWCLLPEVASGKIHLH